MLQVKRFNLVRGLSAERLFARAVEVLGFKRFWVAEHHGAQTVASAATSVVIGHIAGKTSTIRVGSGGVMLPNHSPLVVAEQFGTLDSLYPGRIDLGVGRSSGSVSDGITHALRSTPEARERFPSDLREVKSLFRKYTPDQAIRAVPGAGLDVPIWLLGSSTFSAQQAATLGLPFAFATHIGPDALGAAIEVYPLPPPTADLGAFATLDEERTLMERSWRHAITGSVETVQRRAEALIDETAADELMVLTVIYDQDARRRSFQIVGEVRDRINAQKQAP